MKTNHIKKVLITLDYNPTAQKVAEMGYEMAKSMNAEIIFLHVMSDPVYYSSAEYSPIMGFTGYLDLEQSELNSVEGIKKASLHYLEKTKQHLGDQAIQTIVKEGDVSEAILKTSNDLHVDVIVMGSHSRKWLENIVMGSVTEKVLHQTSRPLFIIPTKNRKS